MTHEAQSTVAALHLAARSSSERHTIFCFDTGRSGAPRHSPHHQDPSMRTHACLGQEATHTGVAETPKPMAPCEASRLPDMQPQRCPRADAARQSSRASLQDMTFWRMHAVKLHMRANKHAHTWRLCACKCIWVNGCRHALTSELCREDWRQKHSTTTVLRPVVKRPRPSSPPFA